MSSRDFFLLGGAILLLNLVAAFINKRYIIQSLVETHAEIYSIKRSQIQAAKDQLQRTYDELKHAHMVIQEELDIAREIQLGIIPPSLPKINGYRFSVLYQPTEKVGGDLYNFYAIDSDHIGIMIADASGHGIPAAFLIAMASMSFTTHTSNQLSTAETLRLSNLELFRAIPTVHFLTAFYAVLHVPSGHLRFTRAGHPPTIHYHASDKTFHNLNTRGMFVAMLNDAMYEEQETYVNKGDRLVFYTDGIIEALNREDERYGKERFESILRDIITSSPVDIIKTAIDDVRQFTKGRRFEDDATMLVVERE